jgi:hypothetical protein
MQMKSHLCSICLPFLLILWFLKEGIQFFTVVPLIWVWAHLSGWRWLVIYRHLLFEGNVDATFLEGKICISLDIDLQICWSCADNLLPLPSCHTHPLLRCEVAHRLTVSQLHWRVHHLQRALGRCMATYVTCPYVGMQVDAGLPATC